MLERNQERARHSAHYEILSEYEFFNEIAENVRYTQEGDRVLLTTMGFDPAESPVARIMEELISAGERNVSVTLGVDAYTFMVDDKVNKLGPLLYRNTMPEESAMNEAFSYRLQSLNALGATPGGSYAITNIPNRPLTNPFAGRSHIKVGIINNEVYVGGCNLFFTEKRDAMVRWNDKNTADWLYDTMTNVVETGNSRLALETDKVFPIDDDSSLLVDAGMKNQSIIYDTALEVIDSAEENLLLVSQYLPSGELGKRLYEAYKRGVDVKAYYNHPNKYKGGSRVWQHVNAIKESRLGNLGIAMSLPEEHPMIHYKILASEKSSMIGSHNYNERGIKWSTAEATLLRHDRNFSMEVGGFVARHLTH